jgi:hypothetical protein
MQTTKATGTGQTTTVAKLRIRGIDRQPGDQEATGPAGQGLLGNGLALVWKQLQQGSFRWSPITDRVMKLSPVEFAALFDGLDWTRFQTAKGILKPSLPRRIRCVADSPRDPETLKHCGRWC